MKLHIISADHLGRIDPVTMERLLVHLPNRVSSIAEADVVWVNVSAYHDYGFGTHLNKLRGKKWVLCDFMEYYGGVEEGKTHLFGVNHEISTNLHSNPEWKKLHDFCAENPPILYFKRELFKADASERVVPIEWPSPANLQNWPLEPKHNFNTRPFEVFNNWGFSHCSRSSLHGEFFKNWCRDGQEVISNFDHIDAKIGEKGRKVISIHTPHSHRRDISEVVRRQAQSRIVISCRGAGYKCFRSSEIFHAAPAIHNPGLSWGIPWEKDVNCIVLDEGNEYNCLMAALQWDGLYDVYRNARETMESYRTQNYINQHVIPSLHTVS